MKKKNYVCVLTVMILLLAACGTPSVGPGMTEPQGPRADLPLAEVYTVLSDDYCRSLADLGIDVPRDVIHEGLAPESFERPVGEKKTYRTERRSFELSYASTFTYDFEGGAVDYYHINGTENGRIGFFKDGRLSKLYGHPDLKVEIGDGEMPEKAQDIVAKELDDMVVFSNYSQVRCHQTPTGRYEFTLLGMHNGHLMDFARVWVGANGVVEHITVIYGPEDGTEILDKVDEKLVEDLIKSKAESLLNTETTELRSYHISDETTDGTVFGRFLTTYQDEVCLRYSVQGDVYVASEERECSVSMDVVIPVRLVTKE